MFLHLGNDIVVNMKDIVGIFDMDNTTITKSGRKFLTHAQSAGMVINTTQELPKSYILVQTEAETKVYISSISSLTLLKRAKTSTIIL